MTQRNTSYASKTILLFSLPLLIALGLGGAVLAMKRASYPTHPERTTAAPVTLAKTVEQSTLPSLVQSAQASTSTYGDAVGQIASFPAMNTQGTVVLIPQFHQQPGSQPGDAVNDRAETTQRQIVSVLPQLLQDYHTSIVMVEGDVAGPVSKQKLDAAHAFATARDGVKNASATLQHTLGDAVLPHGSAAMRDITDTTAALDRMLLLRGAPLALAAEGLPVHLYGTESQATLEKSAEMVRQYLYLQDRQVTLQQRASPAIRALGEQTVIAGTDTFEILKQLMVRQGDSSSSDSLARLRAEATQAGRMDVVQAVDGVTAALQAVSRAETMPTSVATTASVPSRTDNPYASETDAAKIASMMKLKEVEIETTVVEQRSDEAAGFAADLLKQQSASALIMQFGAGHEESLVRALNMRGLSVVVITPVEVVKEKGTQIK